MNAARALCAAAAAVRALPRPAAAAGGAAAAAAAAVAGRVGGLSAAGGVRRLAAAPTTPPPSTPTPTPPTSAAAEPTKAAVAQPKSDAVAKPPTADAGANTIPDSFDQAAGLERAEIDYPDIFAHNEVSRGPFGTESNPALIESAFDERIVGCTGQAAPADHDLHWLTVKKGAPCTCPICGQVFALSPL